MALLRAEGPGRERPAVELRGELVRAEEEGRLVDADQARGWATIRDGAAAGSGAIALVVSLTQALGLS